MDTEIEKVQRVFKRLSAPQERLSVTTAREHVTDGHGGKFEYYCYRCRFFEERRHAADWELLAIQKRRVWLSPKRPTRLVGIGSDEYWRYTIWVGRLVIALWPMWNTEDRASWIAHLRDVAEGDEGQRDRDSQGHASR